MNILIFAFLVSVEGIRHACISRSLYINCPDLGFTELPKIEPSVKEAVFRNNEISNLIGVSYENIEILDLSGNRIKMLNWTGQSLTHLNVSRNPLWKIAHLDAPYLEELDISSCGLSHLSEDFFQNVPSLLELYASNNPLRKISENTLHVLVANNARLKSIPYMPQLHTLEISNNPFLTSLTTTNSLRTLKASNCKITNIQLNALRNLDISKNSITDLILNEELEILDASWNLLRKIDLNKEMLKVVDLSNNLLGKVSAKSPFLEEINLSKNPITELNVLCNSCRLDCSYCQVRKCNFYKVKFLNLTYNNLEDIKLNNVKEVDLRYNLLKGFRSDASFFDLRHNILSDASKLRVTGVGYLRNNPWPCNCDTLKQVWPALKDEKLCDGDVSKDCFKGKKKWSSAQPIIIGFSILVTSLLIIYVMRIRCAGRRNDSSTHSQDQVSIHIPQMDSRSDLPTYEEALTMAKPDWDNSDHTET